MLTRTIVPLSVVGTWVGWVTGTGAAVGAGEAVGKAVGEVEDGPEVGVAVDCAVIFWTTAVANGLAVACTVGVPCTLVAVAVLAEVVGKIVTSLLSGIRVFAGAKR